MVMSYFNCIDREFLSVYVLVAVAVEEHLYEVNKKHD